MVGFRKSLRTLDDHFSLDDVGSTLLEELAKGLYQPHEVIREYVQNAVDAHRIQASETGIPVKKPIQIEVRGNKLSILDWGTGMDEEEIRKVKSIAVSRKRNADVELTGHKGVGIWAGLSFFRTLKLYTTRQGSNEAYELTLNFAGIVDSIGPEVSIGKALNPNYSIEVFQADPEDHFTDVTLEDPVRAREFFLDTEKVINAVIGNCPCELDDNFGLFDRVTQWYEENDLEFFPIEVNGVAVRRSYSSYVEDFQTGTITVNDTPVAKYWKAIHRKNSVISPGEGQLVGFRLIQNGFVLGDANPYAASVPGFEELKLQDFPNWYVGEIHLISHELRPDLRRRELEASEATRQFIGRLRELYKTAEQDARTVSGVRNILKRYAEIQQVIIEATKASAPPLILSQDHERALKDKLDELKEEDIRVHKYKGKQSPDPKIRALREVRPQRKKLRTEIEKLLPGDSTLFESDEISGTTDAASRQQLENSGIPELAGDEERNGGLAKASANVADVDRKASALSVDIVLGLLNEVLAEELSDSPERRSAIMSKLEKRVNEVMSDV